LVSPEAYGGGSSAIAGNPAKRAQEEAAAAAEKPADGSALGLGQDLPEDFDPESFQLPAGLDKYLKG
jgi:hypothetical protein